MLQSLFYGTVIDTRGQMDERNTVGTLPDYVDEMSSMAVLCLHALEKRFCMDVGVQTHNVCTTKEQESKGTEGGDCRSFCFKDSSSLSSHRSQIWVTCSLGPCCTSLPHIPPSRFSTSLSVFSFFLFFRVLRSSRTYTSKALLHERHLSLKGNAL